MAILGAGNILQSIVKTSTVEYRTTKKQVHLVAGGEIQTMGAQQEEFDRLLLSHTAT